MHICISQDTGCSEIGQRLIAFGCQAQEPQAIGAQAFFFQIAIGRTQQNGRDRRLFHAPTWFILGTVYHAA
jgi:hypothetical protein